MKKPQPWHWIEENIYISKTDKRKVQSKAKFRYVWFNIGRGILSNNRKKVLTNVFFPKKAALLERGYTVFVRHSPHHIQFFHLYSNKLCTASWSERKKPFSCQKSCKEQTSNQLPNGKGGRHIALEHSLFNDRQHSSLEQNLVLVWEFRVLKSLKPK